MAMTVSAQALLAKPVAGRWTAGSRVSSHMVHGYVPCVRRQSGSRVLCMSEDKFTPKEEIPQAETTIPPTPTPTPTPTPAPKPRVSTKFGDVFAFSGPAPERINGRLAMIGFTAAMAVELSRGSDLFVQISDGGAKWFVVTSLLLSAASLIPLFKGVTVESKSKGLFTSDAELWNGRLAMLGLIALAFTEYVKGGALV